MSLPYRNNKDCDSIKIKTICDDVPVEIQTVNVVNTVNIRRTKCIDKILQFFKIEDQRDSKEDCTRKQQCVYYFIIWFIFVLFLFSLSGMFLMWFSDFSTRQLQSNLVLANDTKVKQWWQKTPIYPLFKVYIFNYTNTEEFLSGQDDILKLQEVGPLVYNETGERVDLEHHDDFTISYREKKHYEFVPELSNIDLSRPVVVPNILSIIADTKISETNFFTKMIAKPLVAPYMSAFKTLNASEFLWGYDDPILHLHKLQALLTGDSKIKADSLFGIVRAKNGTSPDRYRIHSGINDIKKLGVVVSFNDKDTLGHYTVDACNEINGTDGSQFPPHLMAKKEDLHIFIKTLCRKFPLVFEKEVTVFNGIPALRYKNPDNVFSHPDENPSNQCYCDDGNCPPSGVFSLSKCVFDMPILASFPHFYQGNESLWQNFEGLKPELEKHETYADIHGKLAFPLNGVSRFQLNVQLPERTEYREHFSAFHDKNRKRKYDILPIVWMEITGGDIPQEFQEIIYHSTFTVNAFESNVKFGTMILAILSFIALVTILFVSQRRPFNPQIQPTVTYVASKSNF